MKKTKPFRLAAMTASLFCAMTLFTIPAYARAASHSRKPHLPRQKLKSSRKPRIPLPRMAPGTVVDNATDQTAREL